MKDISGAIACIITLTLANFLYAVWFRDAPIYADVLFVSWHQSVAILVYYFIWIRQPKEKRG